WFSVFQEQIFRWILNDINKWQHKIGGPGKVVEIDKAKFGKRKHNRGDKIIHTYIFNY
ncbi:uncharacterized protein BYT42DRAFT_506392, partial [Radiomyces spectabilis]|uniref:uncharacterized protein n=1 Tax=Radiomyces spectabilis TaxID=64574 RepID=UPI0022209985